MYSQHSLPLVSTVKLKSFPSAIYNRPCSFALVDSTFSAAFFRTAQKCVMWLILKANDRHIFSMYVVPTPSYEVCCCCCCFIIITVVVAVV